MECLEGRRLLASSLALTGLTGGTAGTVESLTITAEDSAGATDTAYTGTVHFSSSDIQAGLPADYTFSATDAGVHTFSVTLETAGTQSVTATDTADATITGTESGLAITPAAASQLVVSGLAGAAAGTAQTMTVTAEDPYGNVATGYAGTVHFTSTDPQAGLPANGTLTNGVGSYDVTLETAGTQSVTATDTADATITGTESGLAITPAAASQLVVSGLAGAAAGTAQTVTVTAEDAYGNVATGYTGTVHVSSTDPRAVLPADYTFSAADAGVHTFAVTLDTAGSQSVTATDAATASITGSETGIQITSGSATHLVVTGLTPRVSGTAETVTVTAEDAYGNVATGYAGTVHFSSTDPQVVLPAGGTLTNGVGSFAVTFMSSGAQTLTATDTVKASITGTETVTFGQMVRGLVYADLNADGVFEAGEPGLAGRVVYLDLNHDGKFDAGDLSTVTDKHGKYHFPGVAVASAAVGEVTAQDATDQNVTETIGISPIYGTTIGVVSTSPLAPTPIVTNPGRGGAAPGTVAAFVQEVYQTVLGRTGSPSEIASWARQLGRGMSHQTMISLALNSTEHRTQEVSSFYEHFLGRAPDSGSQVFVKALQSGTSEQTVVDLILDSPEFQSKHKDPTAFVNDLYEEVLGRQADAAGATIWQNALASGMSRAQVVSAIVGSTEADEQIVTADYTAYLHRPRDPLSEGWTNLLKTGKATPADIASQILAASAT